MPTIIKSGCLTQLAFTSPVRPPHINVDFYVDFFRWFRYCTMLREFCEHRIWWRRQISDLFASRTARNANVGAALQNWIPFKKTKNNKHKTFRLFARKQNLLGRIEKFQISKVQPFFAYEKSKPTSWFRHRDLPILNKTLPLTQTHSENVKIPAQKIFWIKASQTCKNYFIFRILTKSPGVRDSWKVTHTYMFFIFWIIPNPLPRPANGNTLSIAR